MKKWLSAFLFLSLPGGNDALAGWHNVMFHSFSGNSDYYAGSMTISDRGIAKFQWKPGMASVTYKSCSGPEYAGGVYFQEYIAWVLFPKTAQTTDGHSIFFDVNLTNGWSEENKNDINYHFLLNGYEWDTWTTDGEQVCHQTGYAKQFSRTFNEIQFGFRLPADLPKGHYTVPVKYIRGIQSHFYDLWMDHYKIPYNQVKSLPAIDTLTISFDNIGGCKTSDQKLEINHGNLSIDNANGHFSSRTLSINCDIPISIKLSLISNTKPEYNNNKFSVGLGNGLDSIISLDGVERNEETLRWNAAGSKTITIGSKLYGEESRIKPGGFSGSMTMIMRVL